MLVPRHTAAAKAAGREPKCADRKCFACVCVPQGWLNIDFASEVRLEKKLGEGGFGQVSVLLAPMVLACVHNTLLPVGAANPAQHSA